MPKHQRPKPSALIGQRILVLRKQAGISQAALSKAIGFKSPTALFYIEHGKRHLKVDNLFRIAKVLKVSPQMLLVGQFDDLKGYEELNKGESNAI